MIESSFLRARSSAARGLLITLPAIALGALLSACRAEATVHETDPDLNRMLEVPRYDPYEHSEFFSDGMTMRQPPQGTVPFTDAVPLSEAAASANVAGKLGLGGAAPAGAPVSSLDGARLAAGREHFETVCAACHGVAGDGDTVVASHMKRPPPSLHLPRLRRASDAHIQRVIEQGYGYMPAYAAHFEESERWEIVGYVRALQLSQHARLDTLPAALAERARKELP